MRVRDEQVLDEIVFFGGGGLFPASATLLRAVVGERLRLDVAGMRERHDHIGRCDQVFEIEILRINGSRCAVCHRTAP